MTVMIDTNVILDVLCERTEFYDDSLKIFKLCETKEIVGVISALSISNLVYIMRKELNPQKIRKILNILSLIFVIEDLKADDLIKAANIEFIDYEDALQSICATRINDDFIITRNLKDYRESAITAINPKDFLSYIKFE